MEQLQSRKSGPLNGRARIPGDKSISHRAIMFGALAEGETMIYGLLEGEDVFSTAEAMRKMGAKIEKGGDGIWRVFGVGLGNLKQPASDLDMGNSGTSTRLLMGIVATHKINATFTGDASLVKRPMKRVMTPLEKMGAQFKASADGRLPLTVHGTNDLAGIEFAPPEPSAQVKSAILLAGLRAKGKTTVIEFKPTRDHTENMLRHFGVAVDIEKLNDGREAISVVGGQSLLGCAIDVPGDPSSAAFPAVAAILNEGSDITLPRIGVSDRRDGIYTTLKEMGADITYENKRNENGEEVADLHIKGSKLKGVDVPADRVPSMIDEIPVLAMAAACAKGTTRFTGLAELREKESDRLLLVYEGLKACGANVEMGKDWLIIHGTGKPPKGGALIGTALDHRIAMSFLVLGTVSDEPISIDDAAPIKTSFPNFVKLMDEVGADISVV